MENRILTCDNLIKWGMIGLSRSVLCGEREEYVNHLIVQCLFTKDIWNSILNELYLKRIWGGGVDQGDGVLECDGYIC